MLNENIKFVILKKIFEILQPFFKKIGYICVDNLYEQHASCIDTYSIFNHLQNNNIKSRYLVWTKNLTFPSYSNKKDFILFDYPNDPTASSYKMLKKTFISLLTCKYFISSFYGSLPAKYREFVKSNKYIKLVGVGHGPVFLKTLVFNYPFCQDQEWDLYVVSSNHEKMLFEQHGWNSNKLIECSLPRFDCCKNISHKRKKIFIMFTWRLSFEKNKRYILVSKYLYNISHLLNNKSFRDYLNHKNVEIVLGIHHALTDICGLNLKFPCRIADSNHLIDEINTSDLFITDYSSIFWDSVYLNHPCIFYRLDSDDNCLSQVDKEDIRNADFQNEKLYNIFYKEEDVINKIKYYVEHNFKLEKKFEEKMRKYFYSRENNTQKFLSMIEEKYEYKNIDNI